MSASSTPFASSRKSCSRFMHERRTITAIVLMPGAPDRRYLIPPSAVLRVASSFRGLRQLVIPLALELSPLRRMRIMAAKIVPESSGKHWSSSTLTQFWRAGFLRFLECLNCHFARDRRELPEQFTRGVSMIGAVRRSRHVNYRPPEALRSQRATPARRQRSQSSGSM